MDEEAIRKLANRRREIALALNSLEHVKELAEHLSPQERLQLFNHLAELPDSRIDEVEVYSPPDEIQERYAEALKESESRDSFSALYDERNVIVLLKGQPIFELLFYPENLDEAYPKVLYQQYTPLPEATVNQARAYYAERGEEIPEEEFIKVGERVLMEYVKAEAFRISHELSVRLPEMTSLFIDAAIKIIQIDIRNSSREGGNPTLSEIEKIFEPHWQMIKKEHLGVSQGGARSRKSKFTWNTAKAAEFYRTVEALPRHGAGRLPMWEYAQELLRDNNYDHGTIQFLKTRTTFADVPEGLLREAANIWRQYDESWDTLPPSSRPLAFAFRHACHKLGFPYTTYNTVRTKYYEGKKASENPS
jgi:hypothetical protein